MPEQFKQINKFAAAFMPDHLPMDHPENLLQRAQFHFFAEEIARCHEDFAAAWQALSAARENGSMNEHRLTAIESSVAEAVQVHPPRKVTRGVLE